MKVIGGVLLAMFAVGAAHAAVPALRLVGVATLPTTLVADGTRVGGLSGLDYDPGNNRWYFISDDKSQYGPARFYIGAVSYSDTRVDMTLTESVSLRTERGSTFPEPRKGSESSDSEAIRKIPGSADLLWSTEGDAADGFGPAIRRMDVHGKYVSTVPLPPNLAFDASGATGPRSNLSLEGLPFTPDGHLWASMEAPLVQDGPIASTAAGAPVRFTEIDLAAGRTLGQYVYTVDPVYPHPEGRLADNGVSEILTLDAGRFLVLERSGVQQSDGDFKFHIRLYVATLDQATNVQGDMSLRQAIYHPMQKTLVLDFDTLKGVAVDNVEGMTWGRPFAGGHRSLVFVTDNDFSPQRDTQVIVFEVN